MVTYEEYREQIEVAYSLFMGGYIGYINYLTIIGNLERMYHAALTAAQVNN